MVTLELLAWPEGKLFRPLGSLTVQALLSAKESWAAWPSKPPGGWQNCSKHSRLNRPAWLALCPHTTWGQRGLGFGGH